MKNAPRQPAAGDAADLVQEDSGDGGRALRRVEYLAGDLPCMVGWCCCGILPRGWWGGEEAKRADG